VTLVCSFSRSPPEASGNSVYMNVNGENFGAKCIHHYAFCNLFRNTGEPNEETLDFRVRFSAKWLQVTDA
jgi:hypothetical protein